MTFKVVVLCISAFLIQSIAGTCARPNVGNVDNPSCGCISISKCGGPLVATSFGPLTPSGLAVATDIALDGNLEVCGALPFLSAMAFESSFPTSGSAAVSYGCGNGNIAITQEIGNPGGSNAASNSGLGINSVGIGSCGCRLN